MPEPVFETIVIGSGFGGSITAARLAEAGVNTLLLERGPWWDTVPTRSMNIPRRTPFPPASACSPAPSAPSTAPASRAGA